MSETWRDRIETIGSNLLTLEVNTAIKPGMVAQKMPELPIALHAIIDAYSDGLNRAGVPLTRDLLRAAAAHLLDEKAITVEVLQKWFTAPASRPDGYKSGDPAAEITNGAESFEAMQWAAFGALETETYGKLDNARISLQRIRSNSRQLRAAAIVLEQQYPPADGPAYKTRLEQVRDGKAADLDKPRFFGGVAEQTADALFNYPRPAISVAPDLTVLVRKAWDVGLESVVFQTSIQLDGDVLARMSDEIKKEDRDFLHALHTQAVESGIAQWKLLFQTVGELIRDTGQWLFGNAGRR